MSQDDLLPDANPVHMVQWDDDSYSHDLTDGFREAQRRPGPACRTRSDIDLSVGSFFVAESV